MVMSLDDDDVEDGDDDGGDVAADGYSGHEHTFRNLQIHYIILDTATD